GIITTNINGEFTEVNEFFLNMLGYTKEELIQLSVAEITHPEDIEKSMAFIKNAYSPDGHEDNVLEKRYISKNGDVIYSSVKIKILFDIQGNPKTLLATINDISIQKEKEQALLKSETKFRNLYHQTPAMFHSVTVGGHILSVSDYWLEKMGYTKDEVIGKHISHYLTKNSKAQAETIIPLVAKKGFANNVSYEFVSKNGNVMDCLLSAVVDRNQNGEVTQLIAVIHDITKQKQAEKKNLLFQRALDIAPNAIFVTNCSDERIIEVNETACQMLGYTKDELLNMSIQQIDVTDIVHDPIQHREAMIALKERKQTLHFRSKNKRKDGSIVPVDISVRYVQIFNEEYFVTATRDIAEALITEEKLKQVANNEMLLKEIHHRIKNNLQIVSSLISLQSSKSKDKEVIELNHQTNRRIKSISLIHELLYNSNSVATASSAKYINELVNYISDSISTDKNINFEIEIDDFELDLDLAIPTGLVLTELITNCYKHAFSEQKDGTITILVKRSDTATKITLFDNGKGISDDSYESKNTLGTTLIKSLVKQLKAELLIENRNGFYCEISIPLD
ncbi:MAG: PAS domain S-box protein, partial [Flavobacteriales bacterium]|nr:PAS domain S-box protein [Flavobacteriales bacterium]